MRRGYLTTMDFVGLAWVPPIAVGLEHVKQWVGSEPAWGDVSQSPTHRCPHALCLPKQSVADVGSIMTEGEQNKPIIWFVASRWVLCDYTGTLSDTVSFPLFSSCLLLVARGLQQAAQPGPGMIDTTTKFIILFQKEANCLHKMVKLSTS